MNNGKINLKDMSVKEIVELCESIGERSYRGGQVFKWIYKGVNDIDQMTDLPASFREKLSEKCYIGRMQIAKKMESNIDGTIKYLLKLEDSNIIESVLMVYSFGVSACLSTQVGCRMGCSFCASTIGGLVRSLSPGELIDEILTMQQDADTRISNIVLMGSGEPFDNFNNVMKFFEIVNSKEGLNLGMRHITLSTCGLVPEIRKFAELNLQVNLAISLHAHNDETRKKIMPVANRFSISEILEACRHYIDKTHRRVTFEYSLISGVNDSTEDARKLSVLLKGMLCHVNLIPVNKVDERAYIKPDLNRITAFKKILDTYGIEATIRRELGADINAACGQLRKNYIKES